MLSGFIADRFGRKPPIIIAVVLFGVSYAILGMVTSELSGIIHLTTLGNAARNVSWPHRAVDNQVKGRGNK